MRAPPNFRPRWPWVTADLQTIRNVLPGGASGISPDSGQPFEIPLRDESVDRLVARFHNARKPVPTVVLVPGLAGCETSRYVLQSTGTWLASGAPVVRLNLRGSPPGRSPARGHHHMDRVRDLADACLAVADLNPGIGDRGIAIVGFSLGGALALRLAAAPDLPRMVKAVVAVSAPLDLAAAADRMAHLRNRLYERWLLVHLRNKTERVWRHSSASVRAALVRARHSRDFDDVFTSKAAGFRDAADYYASCSPIHSINALGVPTLLLHADDNPWFPPPPIASRPPLRVIVTRGGGHAGFHGSRLSP